MTKNIRRTNHKQRLLIIVVSVVLIFTIITGVIVSFFGLQNTNSTNNEASKRNIELFWTAAHERDVAICNNIEGGIDATSNRNQPAREDSPFDIGLSAQFKKMSEKEAIEFCQSNVQRLIDKN